MEEIGYLLHIGELLDGPASERLAEQACAKLDGERRRRAEAVTLRKGRAESIGAGLLLQLGLQEFYGRTDGRAAACGEDICVERDTATGDGDAENGTAENRAAENGVIGPDSIRCYTVSRLLQALSEPVAAEYGYGDNGKPFFRDIPVCFSLSHSGEYVFCAFSRREVGADIQYRRDCEMRRIVERFFAEEERAAWEALTGKEEQARYFYRLWTRKEAYAKLTGRGIGASLGRNVEDAEDLRTAGNRRNTEDRGTAGTVENAGNREDSRVIWEDYSIRESARNQTNGGGEGYQLSVCRRRASVNEKIIDLSEGL